MDLKPTVFSPLYPGVGLQASMVHTFLTGRFIHRLSWPYYWLALFLFSFLILRLIILKNPIQTLLYTLAASVIFFEIGQVLFQYLGLWIPFFGFILAATFLYGLITFIQFVRIRIEREVFGRELLWASTIQKNMLPLEIPDFPGLEIAAMSSPARHVGGDFYDIVPLPDSRCGVLIGDVSGKGIPAALFMAKSLSEFRRESDLGLPGKVFQRLNTKFVSEKFRGLFLTLLYLVIDAKNHKLTFSNAGHEPIFFYQAKTASIQLVTTSSGAPIGVDSASGFEEKSETIQTGDVLVLISDGVREAMNKKREIFGIERITSAILESANLPPKSMVEYIENQVQKFVKDAPQHDDLTLVCVKVSSS